MKKYQFLLFYIFILLLSKDIKSQNLLTINDRNQIDSIIHPFGSIIGRFSIHPKIEPSFIEFKKYYLRIKDSLHIDSIYHCNFGESATGLLISGINYRNGASLFCYKDKKNHLKFEPLYSQNLFSSKMTFAKLKRNNNNNGVQLLELNYTSYPKKKDSIITKEIYQKFLVFKFNSLIEYNSSASTNSFDTIQIEYGGLYNENPYFIKIYKNRQLDYYQTKKNKVFIHNIKISHLEYKEITNILNYINMQSDTTFDAGFTDSYWTKTDLSIHNGKKISIYDRGMEGSFGLRRFYQAIEDIQIKHFPSL